MNNTQISTPLQDAMNTLSKMPKIDIKGKQYASVASRVEAFRTHFPTASIETILIHDDERRVVIQAKILIDKNIIATGYAEEIRGEGWINSTSALENAETSAIGRALSAFGLSGSEYASSNEVTNAITQQTQMQNQNNQQYQNHVPPQNTNQNQTRTTQQVPPQTQSFDQYEYQSLFNLGLNIVEKNGFLIVIGDDIYSKKDSIKAMGFRFDAKTKSWYKQLDQGAA